MSLINEQMANRGVRWQGSCLEHVAANCLTSRNEPLMIRLSSCRLFAGRLHLAPDLISMLPQAEPTPQKSVRAGVAAPPADGRKWGYGELALGLALLGVGIRLRQYFYNRSLWLDEAMLGLNLIHRSFSQLNQQLDFHQVAPLAWLFAAKACNVLFGSRELALRLPVIAAGVISIVLLLALGKRLLSPLGLCIAVGWFALSRPLIYYSSELKPYGSDPAVAALLWLTAFWVLAKPTRARIVVLALWGALAIWFSYPALFVISGLGLTILWWSLAEGGWSRLFPFIPVLLVWVASFGVNYWFFLRSSTHDHMLLNNNPSLRLSLWHFADVEKPLEMIFALQQNPFTILLGVVVFASCVGSTYYWQRNRLALSLLVSPLLFALLASSLHLYPAWGRFYNFFTPALAILIAAGTEVLIRAGKEKRTPSGAVLVILLFIQPVLSAREVVAHPMEAAELRPVLAYAQSHQLPGDVWYIYSATRHAYRYYAEVYRLTGNNVVIGTPFDGVHREVFAQDASRLRGQRVWVMIANPGRIGAVDDFTLVVQAFDNAGTRVDVYSRYGAVAFLYQMKASAGEHPADLSPATETSPIPLDSVKLGLSWASQEWKAVMRLSLAAWDNVGTQTNSCCENIGDWREIAFSLFNRSRDTPVQ